MLKRSWLPVWIPVLLLAYGISTVTADSGRGRHKQLYIPPTPGEVVVDGRLDDWDLSGQIEMFVVEATRSTQSAKFAAMYDDEALYLAGEVRDPTPMMNRHDPQVNANQAWDADSVQFRLVVDPSAEYPEREAVFRYRAAQRAGEPIEDTRDDIVHLTLWHYTDDGSANLVMQQGMTYRVPREAWGPHGLVPHEKFEGAYRKWEDGGGYTFEYRIPWETLGAERPLRGGPARCLPRRESACPRFPPTGEDGCHQPSPLRTDASRTRSVFNSSRPPIHRPFGAIGGTSCPCRSMSACRARPAGIISPPACRSTSPRNWTRCCWPGRRNSSSRSPTSTPRRRRRWSSRRRR
jgi:hypothetical protein